MTDFNEVIAKWDADGQAGGHSIHPLDPDSPEFWELGRAQAQQVRGYAKPGARVVDFGAGIGRLTIPLVQMGFDVGAVDASTHMLDGLEQRAQAAGVRSEALRLVHSHGPGLTDLLGEGLTDVVIARAVLIHHDYADTETIVAALAALLRPGGHLIADWHVGVPVERTSWTGVTVWHPHHRVMTARALGLEPVDLDNPDAPVWRKTDPDQPTP